MSLTPDLRAFYNKGQTGDEPNAMASYTDGMGGPRSDSKETKDAYERGKKKGQRDAYEWWGKPLEQEVANPERPDSHLRAGVAGDQRPANHCALSAVVRVQAGR